MENIEMMNGRAFTTLILICSPLFTSPIVCWVNYFYVLGNSFALDRDKLFSLKRRAFDSAAK